MTRHQTTSVSNTFRKGAIGLGLAALGLVVVPTIAAAEIVVTATRRDTLLSDTPISITAVTAESLVRSNIVTATELPLYVPGLIISQIGASQITLRGISTQAQDIGGDPGVASYRDDVYLGRPGMGFQEFFDVERVEVIRGPQGTLFGRNTTGGVVHSISRKPTDEFEGYGRFQYGKFDKFRTEGAVSVPIVQDVLAVRVSGLYDMHDGYLTNIFDGSEVQDKDVWAVRGGAQFDPTDNLSVFLTGEYMKSTGVFDPFKSLAPSFFNMVPFPGGFSPISEERQINQDAPLIDDKINRSITLRIDYDLNDNWSVSSITGWRKFNTVEFGDLDDTALNGSFYDNTLDTTTWQQEFHIKYQDDRFDVLAGAFFFWEDASQFLAFPAPIFPIIPISQPTAQTFSSAGFIQGTYNFTDRFRFTGGIRYTRDHKDFQNLVDLIPFFTGGTQTETRTDDAFTPKLGLEWDLTNEVLTYFTVSRGFKSGGYNGSGLEPPFDPEFLWAYEAGAKGDFLDGRVTANLSAYYYRYNNVQVQRIVNIGSAIDNAAKASGYGAELEVTAELMEGLVFDMGLSVSDMEFDEFVTEDPFLPGVPAMDLAGNKLPRVAPFSGSWGLQYTHQMPSLSGALTLRGEAQYRGRIFYDQFNRMRNSEDPFAIFNARLTYENEEGGWYVAAFGKNLGDKYYAESRFEIADFDSLSAVIAPPRTWGIEVGASF